MHKHCLSFVFFLKGFVALCAQTLLIRELFVVSHGNELSFGIIFCIWVISGAVGCIISGHIKKQTTYLFLTLLFFEVLWLFAGLIIIRVHQAIFGLNPGEIINIPQMICLVFITAGIFNFLQGIRFVTGGIILKKQIPDNKAAGLLYGWEGAGALVAGLVFAFVLQRYTDPFQTAGIIMLLDFISAACVFSFDRNYFVRTAWLVLFGFIILSFFYPSVSIYSTLNNKTLMKQWRTKNPLQYYVNTHYGNITVLNDNGQMSFMVDGCLLFTLPHSDVEWIEDVSHFPLLYAKQTDNILVIGAGTKGIIPEILKYNPEGIDCVEIDPELVKITSEYAGSYFSEYRDKRIHFIVDDPVGFLRKSKKKWDVILVDAGLPISLKTARFYTKEFYIVAKEHLNEDGIFYTVIEGSPDYMARPLLDVHKIVYGTLNRVFPVVNIICDYYTGYLAVNKRDAPVFSSDFLIHRFQQKNIATKVISEFYIRDKLDQEKTKKFTTMIMPFDAINSLYRPIIIIPALKHWFYLLTRGVREISIRYFFRALFIVLIVMILIGIIYLLKMRDKKTMALQITVLSTGMLSVAWELVYLFVFQMGFGSIYFYLSVLTGLFMGGLTAGSILCSFYLHRIKNPECLLFIWQIAQAIFAIVSIVFIFLFSRVMIPMAFFFILMIILGFFSGWEFPLINTIYLKNTSNFQKSISGFYAVDLIGSGIGSILTTILFVPFFGLITSGILFFVIRVFAGLVVWKYIFIKGV